MKNEFFSKKDFNYIKSMDGLKVSFTCPKMYLIGEKLFDLKKKDLELTKIVKRFNKQYINRAKAIEYEL